MSTENALQTILVEKIKNDTLVLPTLPAIALKVRKAADDPEVNLNSMGEVVGQDPSLSARMIKIANSAYHGRTVKVNSTSQAVTRIGLSQVKNVATALAMEQLFVSKNDIVKGYMSKVWKNTVSVVAYSMATLTHYQNVSKKRELNMDTMTLAALIHNIGILPILTEAERHEEVFANPSFLNSAVQTLSGKIGESIMHAWGFEEELINIAANWRKLDIQTEDVSYLDFVRVGIALSGHLGNQKDTVMKLALVKGLVADLDEFESEEFADLVDEAKQVFA